MGWKEGIAFGQLRSLARQFAGMADTKFYELSTVWANNLIRVTEKFLFG